MSLYEVQRITDKRINSRTRKPQYRVKWRGYPENQSTWEPEKNLINCKLDIQNFEKQLLKRKEIHDKRQIEQVQCTFSAITAESLKNPNQENDDDDSLNAFKKEESFSKRKNKIKVTHRKAKTRKIEKKQRNIDEDKTSKKQSKNEEQQPSSSEELEAPLNIIENPFNRQDSNSVISEIIDLNSSEQSEDSDFKVLQMCRRQRQYLYLVRDSRRQRWISRNELIRNHPIALIHFYEQRMEYRVIGPDNSIKDDE